MAKKTFKKAERLTIKRPPRGILTTSHLLPTSQFIEVREQQIDDAGFPYEVLTVKSVPLRDRDAGFKASDFSLDAMIAAGSLPQNPSFLNNGNSDAVLGALDAANDMLDAKTE